MQTIEHVMCLLLAAYGNMDFMNDYTASFLLPDAIRMYTKHREYSHFEMKADKTDVSYMAFPIDMKALSPEMVQSHLALESRLVEHGPCAIGEDTSIAEFDKHNRHLPEAMYNGILFHLVQDTVFDAFIRDHFDCRKRYSDEYICPRGNKLNGAQCRRSISDIETQLSYIFASFAYTALGLTANQEWFDKNIYPVLCRDYPQELADNTYKFMQLDPAINQAITAHDWKGTQNDVEGIAFYECVNLLEGALAVTREPFGMIR